MFFFFLVVREGDLNLKKEKIEGRDVANNLVYGAFESPFAANRVSPSKRNMDSNNYN